MRAEVADELRALARCWYVWLAVPLVAFLAWKLLSVNAEFSATFLNSNPQGDDQLADQRRTDAFALYTSGFAAGQLVSIVVGLVVVLRDPRPAGGRGADPHLGRVIRAKAVAAGLFALLLALVAFAVAASGAPSRLGAGTATLADGSLWLVVLGGMALFVLWAAFGVGVGLILGRWRWVVLVAAGYPVVALSGYLVSQSVAQASLIYNGGGTESTGAFDVPGVLVRLVRLVMTVANVLLYPAVVWGVLVRASVGTFVPVAVAVVAVVAASALLCGRWVVGRRHLRHRP